MLENFGFFIGMILMISLIVMVSDKIKIAYPILLVLIGLGISFIPSVPKVEVNPHLIFMFFLPPLLYEAATVGSSWKEIWKWRQMIGSFAFLIVFLTSISIALVSNYFIPGFSLALGFLLGGIVSPPDAVSTSAIMKFVKIPKRISIILEGESLFNDVSSLIVFRFASIAVTTGQFIFQDAIGSFVWMILIGMIIGLSIAYFLMLIHQYLPTNSEIDVVLSIVAPYTMYIIAEEIHASGVMAVVCGGLLMAFYNYYFWSSSSRIQAEKVWNILTFILNGFVFLLIGLDLPQIISGLNKDGIDCYQATYYGLVISVILILVRILAAYLVMFVMKLVRKMKKIDDKSKSMGIKSTLVMGWAGMRGVVSLASALSIPEFISEGVIFPHRSLVIYITFIVILSTLILQGLTLPILIKKMKLKDYKDHLSKKETDNFIIKEMGKNTFNYFKDKEIDLKKYPNLNEMIERWQIIVQNQEKRKFEKGEKEIYLDLLKNQRRFLFHLNNRHQEIDEKWIRKFISRIDLEEQRVL